MHSKGKKASDINFQNEWKIIIKAVKISIYGQSINIKHHHLFMFPNGINMIPLIYMYGSDKHLKKSKTNSRHQAKICWIAHQVRISHEQKLANRSGN
jgi:hypothetical protein